MDLGQAGPVTGWTGRFTRLLGRRRLRVITDLFTKRGQVEKTDRVRLFGGIINRYAVVFHQTEVKKRLEL